MASLNPHKLLLYIFLCTLSSFVIATPAKKEPMHLPHQNRALHTPGVHRRQNNSDYEIQQAQILVNEAIAQQGIYNTYRLENPRRNTYVSRNSAQGQASKHKRRHDEPSPPILNNTLLAAAVLLSEHHAAQQQANGTLHKTYSQPETIKGFSTDSEYGKRDSSYWVADIAHTGHASMGSDDSYMVFRDVTNPIFAGGAKGDGVTDDTAAINAAIAYQSNCGENCLSSSIKGTLIYFPAGTYLISTPINAMYYSQLVGDANDSPIIKTSASFIGLGAIQTDVYVPSASGGEWYIEQSNFYRQVRNLIIDIRDSTVEKAAGLHWQVAQATSLTNVFIYASLDSDTTQMGMFTENGSGGFMSNVYINGGKYGIYGGNQQYTVRAFEITSQTAACICLLWDWGWTWSGLTLISAPVGISLINPESPDVNLAGSIYVMDSLFADIPVAIEAHFMKETILETSIITLDNIGMINVDSSVTFEDGSFLELPAGDIDFVIIGNIELNGNVYGSYTVDVPVPDPSLLDGKTLYVRDSYLTKNRPQYADLDVGSIISVKDHGAVGDGVTDDTKAIQAALNLATTSNLIYFPAGSYIVTSTLMVSPTTRMTGEVWSQIVASGSYFASMANPKVMVQVGNAGDVGTVEISDMLFTSTGSLPGLVLMEWNVQAEKPGSVGIWDAHFRVGGAYGTELQLAQCPPTTTIVDGCVAAAMILHITPQANGYFENMWAWVADHDIDDADNKQVTVAVGRGILVESEAGPTWFYGTASEHSMLYQYNFYQTANVFAGMIQTESPYFQYADSSESPGPFSPSVGLFNNDPDFSSDDTCNGTAIGCDISWAVIFSGTDNVTIAGAGLYSWFDAYDQSVCVDAQNCQQRLIMDNGDNGGFYLWNLVTIGSVEMISNTYTDNSIYAKDNTQATSHPFWSSLGAYMDSTDPEIETCSDEDLSDECRWDNECDFTLSFATLDALQAASGSMPDICLPYYALGLLQSNLTQSLSDYESVNDGYDDVFDDYADYVKDMIPEILSDFMADSSPSNPSGGDGNQYFDCTFESGTLKETQQCPWGYMQIVSYDVWTITYNIKDENGFYNALSSKYGIVKDWVTLGGHWEQKNSCAGNSKFCARTDYEKVNIPQASGNITVPNPKDVITNALPNIGNLKTSLLSRQVDMSLGTWDGPIDDVIQVLSVPVFMINQALQSMISAKAAGQQAAKEKKIQTILLILGIVFMFVPFLDEVLPEVEALGTIVNVVSAIGNVGLSVQGIIADPTSAPMEILGVLAGGGARSEKEFEDLAAARRNDISDADRAAIGSGFKSADDEFQELVTRACKVQRL